MIRFFSKFKTPKVSISKFFKTRIFRVCSMAPDYSIGGSQVIKRAHTGTYTYCFQPPGGLKKSLVSDFIWWQHQILDFLTHLRSCYRTEFTLQSWVKMASKRRVSMPAVLSTIPEVVAQTVMPSDINNGSSIFGPFLRKTSLFANPNQRRSSLDTWALRRGNY